MEIQGISQSDILVHRAIVAGLRELRAQPWLFDYIFRNVVDDELTKDDLGERDVTRAKEWFLGQWGGSAMGLRVLFLPTLQPPQMPCVSIEWTESSEVENTLADTHVFPFQDEAAITPALAGPLDPTSYDPLTGELVLPSTVTFVPTTRLVVVDRTGIQHPIVKVDPQTKTTSIFLAKGTVVDLRGFTIRPPAQGRSVAAEGAAFRETFRIGCHVKGEIVHLRYLYSIVMFLLLRGREALFEARGLERTFLQAGPESRNEATEEVENIWTRYVVMTGLVRNIWPKKRSEKIWNFDGAYNVSKVGDVATDFVAGDNSPEDEAWLAQDPLTAEPIK